MLRVSVGLLFSGILAGCVFQALERDLDELHAVMHIVRGEVVAANLNSPSLVVVASFDEHASQIAGFRMKYGPGQFEMLLPEQPVFLFVFNDLNRDLRYQPEEQIGALGHSVLPGSDGAKRVRLVLDSGVVAPTGLVDVPLSRHLNHRIQFNVGTVTALSSEHFSRDQAHKGLWQPFEFMEDGGAGIHFLQPYRRDRVPVLFVHGINATPRDFEPLVASLDRTRYQAWVYSYPSGLSLELTSRGLSTMLELLHGRHGFERVHVVAHSMGGLVARGALAECTRSSGCGFVRTFVSISSPFGGVESAQKGVRWAPTVVPVWRDLDPSSDYLAALFTPPLPPHLAHSLFFGFKTDRLIAADSSDGVIALSSQLRPEAQAQAVLLRGYDEDHVSILSNAALHAQLAEVLNGQ